MALWTFTPQQVLQETLTSDARIADVGNRDPIVGTIVADTIRSFTLQYTIVSTPDAWAMAAFYQQMQGPFRVFDFLNPNDGLIYQVRFASAMRLELFTPVYFRSGGDIVLTVVQS